MNKTENYPSNIYQHVCSSGGVQTAFDVGASDGTVSNILMDLGVRVLAVEPQSHRIASLKNRNELMGIEQVCVSNEDGEITFHQCSNMPNISTCFSDWKDGYFKGKSKWTKIKLPSLTLDSLIQKYGKPDFIKIDIEGHEDKALAGLSDPIKFISMEYTGGYGGQFNKSLEELDRLGYEKFLAFESYKITKNKKKVKMFTTYELTREELSTYYNGLEKYRQGDLLAFL